MNNIEKEFFVEITHRIKVTQQDIDDIMAIAMLSGINYWASKVKVIGDYLGELPSEQISRGGALKLYVFESNYPFILTLDVFMGGLEKAINEHWFSDYNWYDDKEIDTSMVDAEVADVIIQLALFDDVIYG